MHFYKSETRSRHDGVARLRLADRTVTSLVATSAFLVGAAFPISFFVAEHSRVKAEIALEARLYAGEAAAFAEQSPDFWNALAGTSPPGPARSQMIEATADLPSSHLPILRRVVRSTDGATLVLSAPESRLAPPVVTASHEFGRGLGTVSIEASLRPTLAATGGIAACSSLFALLFLYVLRRVPLRMLTGAIKRANYLAEHDVLTGLANRMTLVSALETAIASNQSGAVLLIDLDRFKAVNDTHGHAGGDLLIQSVARRMKFAAGVHDVVARLGGDEFAILTTGATHHDIDALCHRLRLSLAYRDPEQPSYCSDVKASIGIYRTGDGSANALEALKKADIALYQAKADGRDRVCVYNPLMEEATRARHSLENDIRTAVARRQFTLAYQPQVKMADGTLVGAEALMRWQRPGHGKVGPDRFIPIVEALGLIPELGAWALEEACTQASQWPSSCTISVNVSALQLRDLKFATIVANCLRATQLNPARLVLEITESVLLADSEMIFATLNALRKMGVQIALDDFGTGFSSLSYLTRFPFDKIKIDRSFVQRATLDAKSFEVLSMVLKLAQTLDLVVIAEGIETEEQAALLVRLGCEVGQGYLFGLPGVAEALDFAAIDRSALVA